MSTSAAAAPVPAVRAASPSPSPAAEAARYALLRRLAPSIRHHLVVNLQPIGMVYEVMDRRLRAAEPDLASVREGAGKIQGFARAALDSCLDVVGWLAPDAQATCTAAQAVRECSGLLASGLSFRGYTLRQEAGAVPGQVGRSAIRSLLCATLLHATDELPAPAELVLACEPAPGVLRLTLTVRAAAGEGGFAHEPAYRALAWSDVQALAEAEGVDAQRMGSQRFVLLFPLVSAA